MPVPHYRNRSCRYVTAIFKLKETGTKSIQEILNSQLSNVGPFSKEADQSDIMSGLSDLWKAMEKGVELKSTKVQKGHLFSFVKAVAIHQGWAEKIVQSSEDDEIVKSMILMKIKKMK